jgi:hypothetical protein
MAIERGNNDAAVIGIYAAVVYDVISATNSSPQTTEINAKARASTLMKWVKLGLAQASLFVLVGVAAEPAGKKWRPAVGGGIAAGLLWIQYAHAYKSGMASDEPGTEHDLSVGGLGARLGTLGQRRRAR